MGVNLCHALALTECSCTAAQSAGADCAFMMPVFVDLMMDNPDKGWGKPFYPVIA